MTEDRDIPPAPAGAATAGDGPAGLHGLLTTLTPLRLNIVHYPEIVTPDVVAALIGGVRVGRIPASFDALLDFSKTRRFEIPAETMVSLAMSRRASLDDAPDRVVRNAVFNVSDAVWEHVETWYTLFEDQRPALVMRRFDTLKSALDWLERSKALDKVRAALGGAARKA